MWFGMNTDAVINDDKHDTVTYASDAPPASRRPGRGRPAARSSAAACRNRSTLVSFGRWNRSRIAVVSKRDPVERRQRPERPLLDAQEEAPERRLPVRRVRVDGEQHAEVHVRIAFDLLAVDVVQVVARAPEPEAHPAQERHPELPPEVVDPPALRTARSGRHRARRSPSSAAPPTDSGRQQQPQRPERQHDQAEVRQKERRRSRTAASSARNAMVPASRAAPGRRKAP